MRIMQLILHMHNLHLYHLNPEEQMKVFQEMIQKNTALYCQIGGWSNKKDPVRQKPYGFFPDQDLFIAYFISDVPEPV